MKKTIQMMLVLFLTMSLCACTNNEEKDSSLPKDDVLVQNNEDSLQQKEDLQNNEELSAWMKTKTGKFYSQFKDGKMTMEYEMEAEGMKMRVLSVTNGAKVYSETMIDGQSMGSTLMDEEYMYIVDHNSKMIIQMNLEENTQQIVDTLIEEETADLSTLVSSTKEVNGKTYETEELVEEGAKVILCFDKDKLAYMITEMDGQEYIIQVIQMSNEIDESLFELPEDYEVISY